jgi:hypothetical protein
MTQAVRTGSLLSDQRVRVTPATPEDPTTSIRINELRLWQIYHRLISTPSFPHRTCSPQLQRPSPWGEPEDHANHQARVGIFTISVKVDQPDSWFTGFPRDEKHSRDTSLLRQYKALNGCVPYLQNKFAFIGVY